MVKFTILHFTRPRWPVAPRDPHLCAMGDLRAKEEKAELAWGQDSQMAPREEMVTNMLSTGAKWPPVV